MARWRRRRVRPISVLRPIYQHYDPTPGRVIECIPGYTAGTGESFCEEGYGFQDNAESLGTMGSATSGCCAECPQGKYYDKSNATFLTTNSLWNTCVGGPRANIP